MFSLKTPFPTFPHRGRCKLIISPLGETGKGVIRKYKIEGRSITLVPLFSQNYSIY
jgi:hypothetical protein